MWRFLMLAGSLIFFRNINMLILIIRIMIIFLTKFMISNYSHFIIFHSYYIFFDQMSSFLCGLRVWITLLMILSMNKANNKEFLFFKFTILNLILFGAFMINDYIGFFIFFELSLIPTLVIILGWGIQPERIRAGSYLMIYTIIGAVPLLLCIIFNYYKGGSTSIFKSNFGNSFIVKTEYRWIAMFWILGFIIKLPVYGVHLWLPKAHVEAPVRGSMVLAGVLLKLGAYGLIRVNKFLNISNCFWSKIRFVWFLYSMCMVGFVCFRQSDLKSLVAYSSIAHMSLVMLGVFSFDYLGYVGIIRMLVAHGICSSGLFFCVQCFYELRGTRSIILNRGYLNISPILCFFWFLLCVANASAPPSLNLFREFLLISSILNYRYLGSLFCFMSVFLAGLFSIYLYTLTSHGKWNKIKNYWNKISLRHCIILFLHTVPVYGLLFICNYILPVL